MTLSWVMTIGIVLESVILQSRGVMLAAVPGLILLAVLLPYAKRSVPLRLGLLLLLVQTATLFHPSFATGGGLILESRIIFIGLVSIYLCILMLPRAMRQIDRQPFSTAMLLAFLIFYAAGAVILSGVRNSGISDLFQTSSLSGLLQTSSLVVQVSTGR